MNGVYEFTGETRNWSVDGKEITLKRIRCCRKFMCNLSVIIDKGTLGGWIESENNLKQNGWVADEAIVCGLAVVTDNAVVKQRAVVWGNAYVGGNAIIGGNARIHGFCNITGSAMVIDDGEVYEYANLRDHVMVYNKGKAGGCVYMSGASKIHGQAQASGTTVLSGFAEMFDSAKASGGLDYDNKARVEIKGNARVCGSAELYGDVRVGDHYLIAGVTRLYSGNFLKGNDKIFS